MTPALLALADGRVFRGEAFGAAGECDGEVVFNTSMTGYQEILTDASYRGQIVCMTYPLIGNYGVNPEDVESRRPWVNGFVVKEASGRLDFALSPNLFGALAGQWNSEDDEIIVNFRLNWIPEPGSDVYLVVNQLAGHLAGAGERPALEDRPVLQRNQRFLPIRVHR